MKQSSYVYDCTYNQDFLTHTVQMKHTRVCVKHNKNYYFLTHTVQMKQI